MKNLCFWVGILGLWACQVQAQSSSALVADAESGYLLIKENVAEELPPASLTKVMTLYLTFGALEKGWLKWDDKLPVSAHAASQPRTNLNLQTGQTITVKEAVLALIVHSANDAAVVLAEAMAPNEDDFAGLMTQTAQMLHMGHTTFKNASGLHRDGQKTTAQDMAILTLAVIKHFPQYYPLFATPEFDFNGHTYTSHNHILSEYEGAEGLKTGYVSAVGYNIISTAKKDNVRLVGVVLGKESPQERDQLMANLLDKGFQKASNQKKAVAEGKLSPAFDPLHRRAFLQKVNLDLFSAGMKRQITQAKSAATLLNETSTLTKIQIPLQNQIFAQNGWSVQMGAFHSKEKAQALVASAFIALGQPAIRAVTDQKESLFKARLTGFLNQKYAWEACQFLKKQAYSCFLIPPAEAEGDQ
ncbi:MAG: D-alanyl-D-alanine carboxypeptidase [Alphaproteobacteria bacterium]